MDDTAKANKVARSDEEREAIDKLYRLIDEAEALRDQPGVPEADRVALGKAADAARDALGRYIDKHEQGKNRDRMMSYISTAAAGLVLNDLAGGIMDDPLLILCGLGALGTIIVTQGNASELEIDAAWKQVGELIRGLERTVKTVMATATTCPDPPKGATDSAPQAEPGSRSTADVAPASDRTQPERKDRTCKTVFPGKLECTVLPGSYTYKSPHAALRAMKKQTGNHSLKLHKPEETESGPCPDEGWHYNVRAGSERAGSIACCDCCSEDPKGPAMEKRCRIIW